MHFLPCIYVQSADMLSQDNRSGTALPSALASDRLEPCKRILVEDVRDSQRMEQLVLTKARCHDQVDVTAKNIDAAGVEIKSTAKDI